jgi:uncharacterized protein YjdB
MKEILKKSVRSVSLLLLLTVLLTGLSTIPARASDNLNSQYKEQGYTKAQIMAKWNGLKPAASEANAFTQEAVTTGAFQAAVMKDSTMKNGINTWNFSRWLAGLEDVVLDDEANRKMASGALVNAANGVMSHTPTQPAGMEADLYNEGKEACGSANLFCGSTVGYYSNTLLMHNSVKAWLDDSDSYNVDRLGHRRWMLYPQMTRSGFGAAAGANDWIYTAVQASGLTTDISQNNERVCWPAAGYFPIEFFETREDYQTWNQAWSISLNHTYSRTDIAEIQVTMTEEGGKTEVFAANEVTDNKVFNVELSGYGTDMCIIFRPENFQPQAGKSYHINVSGLKTTTGATAPEIDYDVSFFSLAKVIEPPTTPTTPTTPETPSVRVSAITLNKYSQIMTVGESTTLQATVTPQHASNKAVVWRSSNPHAAVITNTGKVMANAAGRAIISATTVDGGKTAVFTVQVYEKAKRITATASGYEMTKITLIKNKKLKLNATVMPIKTRKGATYKTSNRNIVTVTSTGVIKAVQPGKATITILSKDGYVKKVIKIAVVKKGIKNKKLTLAKTKTTLRKKGSTGQIVVKSLTNKTTDKIIYKVTNGSKLIKVNSYGVVTVKKAPGKKVQNAVVTVKCGRASKKFTVSIKK